jgi:hypothetical protein
MTWLRLDDGMLDHPKWIRAIALGGDEVVTVWLRLLSWCSRNLTDGHVPGDMVAQVAQLKAGIKRSKALRALEEARLITRGEGEEITIVDYLERNPSASQVRAERERKIEAQRKRRLGAREAELHATTEAEPCSVPSHPHPIPSPEREERALGNDIEPEQTEPATHIRIPEGWTPSAELFAEGIAAGVTRSGLEEAVRYWRGRKLGGEWFSIEDFFRGKFASIKIREEKARFAAHQERNAQSAPRASPGGFPGNDLDTTGAATVFHPTEEHIRFAVSHDLDYAKAQNQYRRSERACALDTMTQRRDFMNRLKCWAATGQWIVDGPLPRPKQRTEAA